MQRKLYLEGELGEKYGHSMTVHAESVSDALRLLEVNNSDFRQYFVDCTERGVDFAVEIAGEEIDHEDELLLPITKGDITITAVPAGGGGGFKKVITGLLIIAAVVLAPHIAAAGSLTGGLSSFMVMAGGGMGLSGAIIGSIAVTGMAGMAIALVGVSIAMSGLQEMMAPDPATDNDQESSYLFNGAEQNLIEGDPVPVLYGRLQIPGQPVNFEVTNAFPVGAYNYNTYTNGLWGASGGGTSIVYAFSQLGGYV